MFKPAGSNGSGEGRKQVPEAGWNFHHKSLTAMRPGFLFPGPGLSAGEGAEDEGAENIKSRIQREIFLPFLNPASVSRRGA